MDSPTTFASASPEPTTLPTLYRDRSFWGMSVTQFLAAFNANLFKFLILLLATPTAAAVAAGEKTKDLQSEATIIFAAAFLLFSGLAGFLADKISKRTIIVGAKVAEISVMLAGLIGFYYFETIGLTGMMVILFFMGLQSAFFGPAKYGILPEMVRENDLPRANGVFLMLTFLAIIFGTASAGGLLSALGTEGIWLASSLCVGIAIVGTLTSLLVRQVPIANPQMQFSWRAIGVPRDIVQLLKKDRPLLLALLACSMFWMIGGMVQQSINALGITQLGLNEGDTSILAACVGLGIAAGCLVGGYWSRDGKSSRVVTTGATGMIGCLLLLAMPWGPHSHWLGYNGSIPVLILLGAFAGLFVVPVQVILQSRPPRVDKGRVIAVMNQCTWVAIILGALLFKGSLILLEMFDAPRCIIFAVSALVMLPGALFYRPVENR